MAGKARTVWVGVMVIAGVALGALSAGSAFAVRSSWDYCTNYSSAQQCFRTPITERGWVEVVASIPATRFELCAKAKTEDDNIRSGSSCARNEFFHFSCLVGAEPASLAYVYWAGTGGPLNIRGEAGSPSGTVFC